MLLGTVVAAIALSSTASSNTLNAAIVAQGRQYIGTSLTIRSDNTEQNLIRGDEFGSITPENGMKWDATEPNRGSFNWGGADQIANFATQNKKQMRCHTLVWYSQLPGWVNQINNNGTLMQVMTNHINQVMGRYKGKCTHWDVVNEGSVARGRNAQRQCFSARNWRTISSITFRIAAAADPQAKLYYNDYNLEYGEAKHKGAIRIVKLVQSWGVKIDGVGLQAHLVSEPTKTQSAVTPSVEVLTRTLQDYADLGVDVAYTELDIRMNTPSNNTKLQAHAAAYARVAQSCINVERCVGITLWGVSDKYSWVPQTFSGEGDALGNNNFPKKPAYTSFLNVLNGVAQG